MYTILRMIFQSFQKYHEELKGTQTTNFDDNAFQLDKVVMSTFDLSNLDYSTNRHEKTTGIVVYLLEYCHDVFQKMLVILCMLYFCVES